MIQTVLGAIKPEELGITLMHEHVLCDFGGADQAGPGRYDPEEVVLVMLPHLISLRQAGGNTLVDCTPNFLGRDVSLLKRLSEESRLHLITCTGYYKGVSLPRQVAESSADQVTATLVAEAEEGIEGTEIRPGLIKMAVEAGSLGEVQQKMLRAAARAHLQSGLTIAVHSEDWAAAAHELDLLAEEGVAPEALIWVHADSGVNNNEQRKTAAARGAWVELDAIGMTSLGYQLDFQVEMVLELLAAGFEDRLLLSQDAGWFTVGEPHGGAPRPYHILLTEFVPALEQAGVPRATIDRLLIDNPRRALTPKIRRS